MKCKCVMYVKANGAVRSTKNRGKIDAGEIAFDVEIDIPASVFREPNRRIRIAVPEPDDRAIEIDASAVEVWTDDGGRVHVAEAEPKDGTVAAWNAGIRAMNDATGSGR